MTIRFIYECRECDAKAESERLPRKFVSFTGLDYGLGNYQSKFDPREHAPEGWTVYDHIGCTYCPACADQKGGT
jgi:hypothetical protein